MATKVREQQVSRTVSLNEGKFTGRRVFHVYDDATGNATLSATAGPEQIIALMGTATTPDVLPIGGQVYPGIPILFAKNHNVDVVNAGILQWEVTWDYATTSFVGGPGPGTNGYVDWTMERRLEAIDVWVQNPPNGAPGATIIDIGVGDIDSAGAAVSSWSLQQIWTISETITLNNLAQYGAYANTLADFIGTRNSGVWFGAAIGRVLYAGADDHRVGLNLFEFKHKFIWDQYYHRRQQAERDQESDTGGIKLIVNGGRYHADQVNLVQPFPLLSDFSQISQYF